MFRSYERSRVFDAFVEILESFGYVGTHRNNTLYRGGIGQRVDNMFGDHFLARADDHLDIGGIRTIDDIFLCQQVSSGDHHSSQFMQRDNREPEFITAFQYQHDHITVADPQRLEIGGCPVGLFLQVGKGEIDMFPLVVCPAKRNLIGGFFRPCIYYVISEVEVLRDFYLEILSKIFLRLESRFVYESF